MAYEVKYSPLKALIKSGLGHLEYAARGLKNSAEEIMVVNYHGTQKKNMGKFKDQLTFFRDHFNFITPDSFEQEYSSPSLNGPFLLLTFDDGLKNNLHAIEVLESKGIKAWLFVIPAFIECPSKEQETYILQHIRPLIDRSLDSNPEDLSAMSWDDLRQLHSAGHRIGSHSYTHRLIANHPDENEREKEIIGSQNFIAERLGLSIKAVSGFCCPNNTAYSTGHPEMKLIRKHYTFFFGSYPGSNVNRNRFHVKRSNVETHWKMGEVIWALNKNNRLKWEKEIISFDNLVRNA